MSNVLVEKIDECRRDDFKPDNESLKEKVVEILSNPILPIQQEKVYSILSRYTMLYFASKISEKYPLISNEIFNLKNRQKIQVDVKDSYGNRTRKEIYEIDVPTIVKVSIDSDEDVLKKGRKGKRKGEDYPRDVEIYCSIPEVTNEARVAISDAVKFCADLTAEAYKDEIHSKILTREFFHKTRTSTPLNAYYSLVWAPSKWNAEIIEIDPAIFLDYSGGQFLVYNWEIPEERNLESLLKEFRGEVNKMVK